MPPVLPSSGSGDQMHALWPHCPSWNPGGSDGKESACSAADPGGEDALEKGMAGHSRILAWGIPWTEDPGGLQSIGHRESDTTEWAWDLTWVQLYTVRLSVRLITLSLTVPLETACAERACEKVCSLWNAFTWPLSPPSVRHSQPDTIARDRGPHCSTQRCFFIHRRDFVGRQWVTSVACCFINLI